MASYWKVGTKDDSLSHYVWADNAQHAVRKVEAQYGGMPPQRTTSVPVEGSTVPEGDEVIDEPQLEREARSDYYEQESSTE